MTGAKETRARVLMVQGASSSAGKSLLVTALCHSFSRRGVRVAPFKAQNMSNNAAVCPDGAEIGRAQYVQALAAGIEPCVEINPVLIKPEADACAQIIVMGRPFATLGACAYYDYKDKLWKHVTTSLDRLRARYDLLIIEGAGSPAELNLKSNDIVNMAVARYAKSPVLLIGDIDRGGIFAQLLGTLWLLDAEERALVRGLVVNKFRGDLSLFEEGVRILEKKGNLPVLGVVPYLNDLRIPEEDAVALEIPAATRVDRTDEIDIAILRLPLISNFDDFDPFCADRGVRIRYVTSPDELGHPDAIIIPGTKSTIADLAWLRSIALEKAVIEYAYAGGALVGICGGYQMLGQIITDPGSVETQEETTLALGLLPLQTQFLTKKATYQARARIRTGENWLQAIQGQNLQGYEIHMGYTKSDSPWLEITARNDAPVNVLEGAMSSNGRIWGCYLHGIFANQDFRYAWLNSLGRKSDPAEYPATHDLFSQTLTRLTNAVETALDMKRLEKIIWDD